MTCTLDKISIRRFIMKSMKFLSAFSLLIAGAIAAPGVFAGEAYVTNTHRNSQGSTDTYLNINSQEWSSGQEFYESNASGYTSELKINDDNYSSTYRYEPQWQTITETSNGERSFKDSFKASSSTLFGEQSFGSETSVFGDVISNETFTESSSTTASGVR